VSAAESKLAQRLLNPQVLNEESMLRVVRQCKANPTSLAHLIILALLSSGCRIVELLLVSQFSVSNEPKYKGWITQLGVAKERTSAVQKNKAFLLARRIANENGVEFNEKKALLEADKEEILEKIVMKPILFMEASEFLELVASIRVALKMKDARFKHFDRESRADRATATSLVGFVNKQLRGIWPQTKGKTRTLRVVWAHESHYLYGKDVILSKWIMDRYGHNHISTANNYLTLAIRRIQHTTASELNVKTAVRKLKQQHDLDFKALREEIEADKNKKQEEEKELFEDASKVFNLMDKNENVVSFRHNPKGRRNETFFSKVLRWQETARRLEKINIKVTRTLFDSLGGLGKNVFREYVRQKANGFV
jgi:hypothetical protein